MALGMEVGLGPGHILLDGDPAPPPKKVADRPLSIVAKRRWIKMPLGTEVGLHPGYIVLDAACPPQKGTAPNFWPMSIEAKRLYASGYHLVRR